MTYPIVYEPAQFDAKGPMPGARLLMASILQLYPGSTNLGWYHQGKRVEPGAALTAPALANTCERGASVSDRTCSVDGCVKPHYGKGWCNQHWQRWRRHGDPTVCLSDLPPAEERFWAQVETSGECRTWTGLVNAKGYGRFWRGIHEGGLILAHRFSWQLATGIDPGGLCVLHLCDNPPCVNPDHLVLGTKAANNFDMVNKGRYKNVKVTP